MKISGQIRTETLFWERREDHLEAKYTLKDEDRVVGDKTYPSLRLLYLAMEDLTEYKFALKYFDSWEQWKRICANAYLKTYIQRWRTELELKLKSEALESIITESRLGGKNAYDAKKYIIAKGWIGKEIEANRRGRPSKQDILQEASRQALANFNIDEVLERIEEPLQ